MQDFKATLEYSIIEDGNLKFVEGIGFYGDNYKQQALNNYKVISDNFEFELYGDHLFDLFIDGDLVETFSCNQAVANKIREEYFSKIESI